MVDFDTYLSPFSWRYGSDAMRRIWSETNKRKLWRQIWVALAEVQSDFALVSAAQVEDLKKQIEKVDIQRALELEAEIHHDLMAELLTFAEQAEIGGGALHLGATSMDIEDNAEVLRIRHSLDLITASLRQLLITLTTKVDLWADLTVMGFTHLQPAEPTTLGYRLAFYAQDLLEDYRQVQAARNSLRGKGFTGAVGTSAAYAQLVGIENLDLFNEKIGRVLDLPFVQVSSQVYPRKQDWHVINALAGIGASLHKMAFDLRFLQSPVVGETSEPFGTKQVGSSAMPFKRNPINAEKIDSIARLLAQLPRIAWDNAANSLLERTLDDSANRRSILPESFLMADELINVAKRLVNGLVINQAAIQKDLDFYGPFSSTERILMASARAGADRQKMHEHLRELSMDAWKAVHAGNANPLIEMVSQDPEIACYLSPSDIRDLMDYMHHTGDAPNKARALAVGIRELLI